MRLTGTVVATLSLLAMTGAVIIEGAQAPTPAPVPASVQFIGQASPPSAPLSLWYRAPAADRPLIPRPSGRGANAEWVRALPVGNGRLARWSLVGSSTNDCS